MELYEKLRKIRRDAGYTQKILASETGISEISIRQYESGSRKPKIEQLAKIAEALDTPLTYLLEVPFEVEREVSTSCVENITPKQINEIKQEIINNLQTLAIRKLGNTYSAISINHEQLEALIEKLLLVFEIEVKSNNCIKEPILKANTNHKEGE